MGETRHDDGPYRRRAADDFEVSWHRGSGKGGQHRNKHATSVRVTHLPTGLVKGAQTRSRENSMAAAMAALAAELDRLAEASTGRTENGERRNQVGSGERSDRRRTYQFQNNIVRDHATGRTAQVDRVMRGGFDLLW